MRRTNPLAYPAGRLPGFDPSHVAAPICRFSGITAGGGFVSCLNGARGVAAGSPSSLQFGSLGPVTAFPNAGGADQYKFSGGPVVTDTIATLAAIFYLTTVSASAQSILQSSGIAGGLAIEANATTGVFIISVVGAAVPSSGLALVANVPYFVAASVNQNKPVQNYVIARLDNGQIKTATTATAGSASVNDGKVIIGNRTTNALPLLGGVAAAMYSGQFLSLQQLATWAADPWSFWYPQSAIDSFIFRAPSAASFVPAWARGSNLPVIGMGVY